MSVNVDAILENADWVKQTRDFPPGALEEQAHLYGISDPASLPASYLPREALSAAYVEAEHPRDPQGRWTEKGGSGGTSPAEEAQKELVVMPPPERFESVMEAEKWFRDNGVPDVDFSHHGDFIHSWMPESVRLDRLTQIARAWAHEVQLYPDIAGPNGLKGIFMSGNPRLENDPFRASFETPGVWATTAPYTPFAEQDYRLRDDNYYVIAPPEEPYPSMIVLRQGEFGETGENFEMSGMAPNSPEQAFAHELGHVHANALGRLDVDDAYSRAVEVVETEMQQNDLGNPDFESQVMTTGAVSGEMAEVLSNGVSTYAASSPQEAFAEHFVRRTYRDSARRAQAGFGRGAWWKYAQDVADAFNSQLGMGHQL